jgi:hypothetical protein
MFCFEAELSDLVLLKMVVAAKTDAPSVRRLEPGTAIGAFTHVSTFDRQAPATWHGAAMPPDPRPMRSTGA